MILIILLKQNTKIQQNITESFTELHLEQTTEYNINRDESAKLKYNIKKEKL